eukprot:CAMPEP_0177710824 /NCGR_PEP_ID=MMETSP0484_2-20121128/11536_1 /TAXON_ID=354590 /ORGANISM="Rhodomonas lens, Strain RHODO" /LENGTH=226 /DNA_ID=CAMNT_0019222521 /DNA_START=9 /DNA_END=689 /DNA_ORIENTATION=+
MARFTDELKEGASEKWNAVVNHPWTDALADGTLAKESIVAYLIQDHRFLDSFVVLLASMIAKAPTLQDRLPGCQFLALITGKENTYFERSFEALEVTVEQRTQAPNSSPTRGFMQLMTDAAQSGNYAQMLCVLCVAEWSYLSWADRVKGQRTDAKPFYLMEWIDLHCGEGFEGVIAYLRSLLDNAKQHLSAEEQVACHNTFQQAVALEEAFFDHAWAVHTAAKSKA